jgi:hypothetical protein
MKKNKSKTSKSRMPKQLPFNFGKEYRPGKTFGGEELVGKRKSKRPISDKQTLHLVLKSEGIRASEEPNSPMKKCNLFSPASWDVEKLIQKQANKYGIKIEKQGFAWTHLHILIMVPSRKAYNSFIRTLTSLIVDHFSKAKGISLKGLFTLRPHTTIVTWGREYNNVIEYIVRNDLEARGLIKYQERKRKKKPNKGKLCTAYSAPDHQAS